VPLLNNAIINDKTVLFEGAQAAMLDLDYGTYPFVTSSNPTAGGAVVGSGVSPSVINQVYGVTKAYVTRVGAGRLVTEITPLDGSMTATTSDEAIGLQIQQSGFEIGATTGRTRRCG